MWSNHRLTKYLSIRHVSVLSIKINPPSHTAVCNK